MDELKRQTNFNVKMNNNAKNLTFLVTKNGKENNREDSDFLETFHKGFNETWTELWKECLNHSHEQIQLVKQKLLYA